MKYFITPNDVKEEFGICINQQKQLRHRTIKGLLDFPFIKVGGLVRYRRDDIINWMDKQPKFGLSKEEVQNEG